MKSIVKISGIILLVLSFNLFNSCKKEKPAPPVVTTAAATDISYTTAVSGGNITSDGGATVISRGICWNTAADPKITNSIKAETGTLGSYTSSLTQLTPNTKYYVKAYAINAGGTGYGDQVTFTTSQVEVPVLTTTEISSITQITAVSGGNITDEKGGSITERGVCWSTGSSPTIADNKTNNGTGPGSFVSNLSNLQMGETYNVRAYATNSAGTGYGNIISFTSLIMDMDDNVYSSIKIGDQLWLVENMKTTRYNDGSLIFKAKSNLAWSDMTSAAYGWYNNDSSTYMSSYGAMYNWYAVATGMLCPQGWHVPTNDDWTALTDYLGGLSAASGKLKEAGTNHWNSPNNESTNSSGFTVLPGGYRSYSDGVCFSIKDNGSWWSSTSDAGVNGWMRAMTNYGTTDVRVISANKKYGLSVRCLKN